jgi:hypothetical protein
MVVHEERHPHHKQPCRRRDTRHPEQPSLGEEAGAQGAKEDARIDERAMQRDAQSRRARR